MFIRNRLNLYRITEEKIAKRAYGSSAVVPKATAWTTGTSPENSWKTKS